ncbi:MAG: tail fiber domain-containing protein [Candidatus Moraniibacteriota bacterium]
MSLLLLIIVIFITIGTSPQLTHAWTEPTLTAPNGNLAAPINAGLTTQTKTGALYVNGGVVTPLIWDTDNTLYYLNPFGASQISSIFANGGINVQGNTSLAFSDHNGGFNMVDNTWIRATGVGNIYAPGEMQATNIRANSNLCIGSDCRSSWAAGGLQLDTWQSNHYSGSDGAEYATIFYDTNNSGYYLNPNGMSNLERVDFSYGYDRNNTGYYIDLDNRTNLLNLTANGDIRSPIFYDQNNTGYYVDPNGSSRMNTLNYVDQAYIVDVRPQYMYDWNDSAYYIDLNSGSRFNYMGRNYGFNWTEYDWNNTAYYVDPNNVSIYNDIRANVFYDYSNTGYYMVPRATSRMNYGIFDNLYSYGWMQASSFLYASDRNLKKDIAPLENSLDKISQLQGVNFRWKDSQKDQKLNVGLVAQDVEEVYPELVNTDEQTGLKSVEYGNLVAPLIESIKEQQKQIDELKAEINQLKNN